ncbi:MAG: tRNA pseudouridine(55) synthase TruB [Alphaproteobacteria bacterium]|nr:tRNA pseudouridine(55) synthase TruB [Alphaproteobacteria bacterium]
MADGWVILDKESGVFSKTAAMRAAKIFGTKKNGHIGTLDPMASGVLPVAIGNATKMVPFIEEFCDRTKEYLFNVQFGFETDTLDATGTVVTRTDIVPDESAVRGVLQKFIGRTCQIPPVYSAVHISGVRAYELARAGKTPEIPARTVEIYELELTGVDGENWNFRMQCAPGTYVRSVARDIAHACGTVATVGMIRRTKTSGFSIKNAVKLDFLENLFNNGGDVGKCLMSVDSMLGGIPVLNLERKNCRLYKNGGFINVTAANGTYRVYSDGKFIGIGTVESNLLRPKRTI